uniref:Uncharacterized protein n=1 Tax=viral metagenome TaxID=1070528 RepID=A0A6C0BCC4_9ZZZZ
MNLLKKKEVTNAAIIDNLKFSEHQDYVKGYFTNTETILNNNDFLDIYRYVQYWSLPNPEILINYAKQPNYATKSLLANMKLTGEDSYFEFFRDLVEDAKYKASDLNIDESVNDIYTELVIKNRIDLFQSFYEKGFPFVDIFPTNSHGNETLEIVTQMLLNDYSPSDEIVVWYINRGFGKIANLCIPYTSDDDFFFNETPKDLDFYEFLLERKFNSKIPEDEAETLLNKLLTDDEDKNNIIDVALFQALYKACSNKMSLEYKKILLSIVCRREQRDLTWTLLNEFDNEKCEFKFSRSMIEELIQDVIKNKSAYIVFTLQILERKNFNTIIDICKEMSDEFNDNYEINSLDFNDIINEKYCENSDSDSDDCDEKSYSSSEDDDEYNYKYNHWEENTPIINHSDDEDKDEDNT